ncbi:MAG TPA: ferredoxin, partial [Clostridiales bacterium]|nr:ferredoxin [Clostridiales bacterium]
MTERLGYTGMNVTVSVLPEKLHIRADEGENLLKVLTRAGFGINASCAGKGTCGKCLVRVLSGSVPRAEGSRISQTMREHGFVESCLAFLTGDVTLEIPAASRLKGQKTLTSGCPAEEDHGAKQKPCCPAGQVLHVTLAPPCPDNPLNDLDRFKAGIMAEYRKRIQPEISALPECSCPDLPRLQIPLEMIRELPEVLRDGDFHVTVRLASGEQEHTVIDIFPGLTHPPLLGLAVDIGTTTLAAALVDLPTGAVLAREGTYNPQASYGSDIISRIIYAEETPGGLETLRKCVVDAIDGLAAQLLARVGHPASAICSVVIAGNTVMTGIFYGIPVKWLRLEPYVPAAVALPAMRARETGLRFVHEMATLLSVPGVSSYIGGDITSGVLVTEMDRKDELSLFIDIGTNGELVLGHSEWLVSCSCSAGPAFEGSGIRCGMRAMDGAIDSFFVDPSGKLGCRVIGDSAPSGICGSGLMSLLALLVREGITDRAGNILRKEDESPLGLKVREGPEGLEIVLIPDNELPQQQGQAQAQG